MELAIPPCTKEEQSINRNARLYAKTYNEAMLDRLKSGSSVKP